MPEVTLLVRAAMFGFMLLLVCVIAVYHVALDPRRAKRRDASPAAPAKEPPSVRSARAA